MELFECKEIGAEGEAVKSVSVGAELVRLSELADLSGDFGGVGFVD